MTRIKFLCLIVWLCSALSLQGQTLSEGFTAQTIPDSIWQHMQGRSYQPNPHIQRADLCYLRVLHYDYDGRTHQGELVCNKRIASKLLTIFRELYEARYPIQRITLSDNYDGDDERQMRANNTSCFNYRVVSDTKHLSKHAYGLAIDINPLYNPYVRYSKKTVIASLSQPQVYLMLIARRISVIRLRQKISATSSSSSTVSPGAAPGVP